MRASERELIFFFLSISILIFVHTVFFSLLFFLSLSRIKSGISSISSESFGRAFKTPHLCYKNSWKQLLLHRIIHFCYSYVRLANSSICYHFIDILFCTRLCLCMYRFKWLCVCECAHACVLSMHTLTKHHHHSPAAVAADSYAHILTFHRCDSQTSK